MKDKGNESDIETVFSKKLINELKIMNRLLKLIIKSKETLSDYDIEIKVFQNGKELK